jgi:Immunity protein 35
VIDVVEARRLAQQHLDGDRGNASWLVLTREQEFADGWVFYYDSRQHQATGAFLDAVGGNAPIIVDWETGELSITGTARPIEDYVAEHAESARRIRQGWPVGLDERLKDLLVLARDGLNGRSARTLGRYLDRLHPARPGRTVLDELLELERRRLIGRRDTAARAMRSGRSPTSAALLCHDASRTAEGPLGH